MALSDYLSESRILIGLEAGSRRDFIQALAAAIAADKGCDVEAVADPLLAREKLGSTAIGKGVALPHAKSTGVTMPVAAVAVLAAPLSLSAPDDVDVDLVFAIVLPSEGGELAVLSQIVRELRDERLLAALREARSPAGLLRILEDGVARQ